MRIKRIDLPREVSESVFERMRTERQQVATKHRSDGKAAANAMRAQAESKATILLANARKGAAKIRAEGVALAAKKPTPMPIGKIKSFMRSRVA